jgi:hypothetical protein
MFLSHVPPKVLRQTLFGTFNVTGSSG